MSIGDIAYERLARLIETCELPPGWHFGNETDEAARLGMSRTPFREALQRLEQEGLISKVAKHRTFVTKIDPREFEHYMVVRRGIEVELLRDAFEFGARFDLKAIASLLKAQTAAARAGEVHQFLELDQRFHMAIAAPSLNAPALAILATCWRHINRARYMGVPRRDYVTSTLAEHRAIVTALKRHDLDGADVAIRTHTGASARRRVQQIRDTYPDAFIAGGEAE